MKKILYTLGVSLLIAGGAQAATVFTENFNGQSFSDTNTVPIVFGGASPDVAAGAWFGSSVSGNVSMDNELQLKDPGATNRGRGAAIWLDSSAWSLGTATVTFDILDYGGSGEAVFQAYYANGVDGSSSVSFDLHGNQASLPVTAVTGSATIGTIGARNTITANETQASFTFDFTGQENIALVFWNRNQQTWSVDNLTVTVPEPATSGMLFGLVGLSALFIRRRKA